MHSTLAHEAFMLLIADATIANIAAPIAAAAVVLKSLAQYCGVLLQQQHV